MEMTIMYVIGSLVGLILTGVSFIMGTRALQEMERDQWEEDMKARVAAIR